MRIFTNTFIYSDTNDKSVHMIKKIIVVAIISSAITALGNFGAASEDVDVSVTVNNNSPVAVNNTAGPLTIDPEVQYTISTTVYDDNKLQDINTIVIKLYYDNDSAGNGRNYYTWTWTNPNPGLDPAVADFNNIANWSENVAGSYISTTNVSITLDNKEVTLEVNWQVRGIARPSDADFWHYHIEATDSANPTVSSGIGDAQVNKYISFSVQSNTINFGNVDPGAAAGLTNDDAITIVSNGEVDISVTGADLTSISSTIDVDQFYVEDDISTQTTLTTAAQIIYDDYRQIDEGGFPDAGILGYSDGASKTLLFGGTIPDPQEADTYTGTWVIDVTNVCTPVNGGFCLGTQFLALLVGGGITACIKRRK